MFQFVNFCILNAFCTRRRKTWHCQCLSFCSRPTETEIVLRKLVAVGSDTSMCSNTSEKQFFVFSRNERFVFEYGFFSNSAWWKDAKYFSLVLAVTADFFDRRRRLICRSTSFRGPHSTNCLHCKRKNKEPVFQVFLSLYRFSGFLLSRVFQENVEIFFRGKKGQ